MADHQFIYTLTVVLGVAAVTTIIFQKIRQPVIFGYIVAGMIVGPYIPLPLIADTKITQELAEIGLIFIMFSIGLEFSLRKFLRLVPSAGFIAVLQSSFMVWLGYLIGKLMGWSNVECLFTGALIAISSTTIIAKTFQELNIKGKVSEIVFGVLIMEDVLAILLLAFLPLLVPGSSMTSVEFSSVTGALLAFLALLLIFGLLLIPRFIRLVAKLNRPEITLIASVAIALGIAMLSRKFGYSEALGAFFAGAMVAESGESHRVEHQVRPLTDLFGAIFFIAVGMMINPRLILEHWGAILILSGVVILGKIVGVGLGTFLTGNSLRTSLRSGMSLAQIGEFSFIIAGAGIAQKLIGDFLFPVAVAVSALTTLVSPWLIRFSDPVSDWIDGHLPRPLQSFVSVYGCWMERLKDTKTRKANQSMFRKQLSLLLVDASLLVALIFVASLARNYLEEKIIELTHLKEGQVDLILLVTTAVLAVPLVLGLVRAAGALGRTLADQIFPSPVSGKVDMANAPRRAMVVTMQIAFLLLISLPILVLTQPVLPLEVSWFGFAILLCVLAIYFWRSAASLQGHLKAGSEVIIDALLPKAESVSDLSLQQLEMMLPGLGPFHSVRLMPGSAWAGKTLADINLRAQTGANVVAILRGEAGVMIPTGNETLRVNDQLIMIGTEPSIQAAEALLKAAPEPNATALSTI